jgi:signal transduction histidine kinase/CheY-like chemotaxis protein
MNRGILKVRRGDGGALGQAETEIGSQVSAFVRIVATPLVVTDIDGVPLEWNGQAAALLGWPSMAQDTNTTHPTFVKGAPRWFQRLRREALLGETSAAALLRRRNGEGVQRLRLGASALRDGLTTLLIFAFEDRTRVRKLERRLHHVERRNENTLATASATHVQKMEAVGRLAGGVAQDFNNLLTAIQGHAQFLIEDLSEPESGYANALEIKRAADRAAVLTRQLLIFSRKQPFQAQMLDLNAVIRDIEKLLRHVIREDITLDIRLGHDLLPVRADASQIEQVLVNLVVNARDAMPGGGTISIRTRNHAVPGANGAPNRGADFVQLLVRDTGVGMNDATRSRIFEPFFTTKLEGQGTGLGLATVYGIVQQAAGTIEVESEPGKGSTFRIDLPAFPDPQTGQRLGATDRLEAHGTECVLVVDEDPTTRSLTSRSLRSRGYAILEAGTADSALSLAQRNGRIDLVITDIVIPEMSGRRLAENLCSTDPSMRVLFLSRLSPEEVVRQGLVEPQARLLEKPFTADRLARRVREVLDEPN